jgi:hypothetical protein
MPGFNLAPFPKTAVNNATAGLGTKLLPDFLFAGTK